MHAVHRCGLLLRLSIGLCSAWSVCLSVCLSVCASPCCRRPWTVQKRQNWSSIWPAYYGSRRCNPRVPCVVQRSHGNSCYDDDDDDAVTKRLQRLLLLLLSLLQVAPSSEKNNSFSSTRPLRRAQPAAGGADDRQRHLSDALAKLANSPFVFTLIPPSPHNHTTAVSVLLSSRDPVSYTHLTLPTIYSV